MFVTYIHIWYVLFAEYLELFKLIDQTDIELGQCANVYYIVHIKFKSSLV